MKSVFRSDVSILIFEFIENVGLLKFVSRHFYRLAKRSKINLRSLLQHKDQISWIEEKQFEFSRDKICIYAVIDGNLDLLKWYKNAFSERYLLFGSERLATVATDLGRLSIIKWLRRTGQKWNARNVAFAAAYSNQMRILKWLKNKKFFNYQNKILLFAATKYLNDELFYHIHENSARMESFEFVNVVKRAVLGLNYDLILWLIDYGYISSQIVVDIAQRYQMTDLLIWLDDVMYPPPYD